MKLVLFLVLCVLFPVFGDGHKSHGSTKSTKSSHKSHSKTDSNSNSGHMSKAAECKRPKTPLNGRIVITSTVECDTGYTADGTDQITCRENGEWSDVLAMCVYDPCANEPCDNGGTCVVNGTGYICQCASRYTGVNCTERRCSWRKINREGSSGCPLLDEVSNVTAASQCIIFGTSKGGNTINYFPGLMKCEARMCNSPDLQINVSVSASMYLCV